MKRKIKRDENAEVIRLGDAYEEFIQAKTAVGLAEKTLKNYSQSFGYWKRYNELDDESLCSAIDESTLYKFIAIQKNNDLSNNALNHYLRDIRVILYWMMEKEYVKPFKIKCVEAQDEGIKFFCDEDIDKLMEKPRKQDSFGTWRTYTIICFILATGARPSTVINVKVEDLNFTRGEIHYAHTKAKNAMTIPISKSLEIVLKEYLRTWKPTTWLFPNTGDEQLTINGLRMAFVRYCKERDVKATNIYGLRHNFGRNWIMSNGGEIKLMNILGHKTLSTTRRYTKLFGQDLKTDYEEFSMLDQLKKPNSRRMRVGRSQDAT